MVNVLAEKAEKHCAKRRIYAFSLLLGTLLMNHAERKRRIPYLFLKSDIEQKYNVSKRKWARATRWLLAPKRRGKQ